MLFHSMFFSQRIGEAANPGPDKGTIRLAVSNPTAIYKKVPELLKFGANIITTSETSATSIVQKDVSHEFNKHGFRSYWCPPVARKKQTTDGRPSYRGEALGTGIFTSLPSRFTRIDVPSCLRDSQRFCSSIIRFGKGEIHLVCIYGFATRHMEGKRPNDLLLAAVAKYVDMVGLPFIICGDFNEPPFKLPSSQFFKDLGAVEAFQWFENRYGSKLPATCAGSTRNDTAIIHPLIAQCITNMQVDNSYQMDLHTPLFIDFKVNTSSLDSYRWDIPKTWAPFAPPKHDISQNYHKVDFQHVFQNGDLVWEDKITEAFRVWSAQVEKAVDKALHECHVKDPIRHPMDGLSHAFKSRCKHSKPVKKITHSPIKSDRHGGYNPVSEACSLNVRLKTRQVRRLQSLLRRLKALPEFLSGHPGEVKSFADALVEWNTILHAKGYGNSWHNWISSFEAIPPITTDLPTFETVEMAMEVTKLDCDHSCREETRRRHALFQTKLHIDQTDDFSRMSYRIIKSKEVHSLNEVPAKKEFQYNLIRSRSKSAAFRLLDDFLIPPFATVYLNEARIEVLEHKARTVFFRIVDGKVQPDGICHISFTAMTPQEITDEFESFWTPFWKRDQPEEQFNEQTWSSFQQALDACDLPRIPQIVIDLDDKRKWYHLVKTLPSGKAVGPCGWSNDELKSLPSCCIDDLIEIFQMVSVHGFGRHMMTAKTVLLAKIPIPLSMHHARPVTILSSLYRLYSRFVFKSTAGVWKEHFPQHISGGLPGRGVKEMAFLQKRNIEEAISQGSVCGGFTLDLIKAFNTFGRFAVACLMIRLGMPSVIVQAWIQSLSEMVRFPTLSTHVGSGIDSTTGVPEGCSISVLAMMATACFYYYRIATPMVSPYAYADNWSWCAKSQREHLHAYHQMQETVDVLRLQVDYDKSWHWATSKSFRKACEDFHTQNGEEGKIQIKQQTKDLGEIVHYNRSTSLGFIKEKIAEASARIRRIEWLPASLQKKATFVQSACWPLALYSSDTTYIGQQHFVALRRAVVDALAGHWHTASPLLACAMLSNVLIDPFLHTLCTCARTIRRLANVDFSSAEQTVKFATEFCGSRAFGPASTLKLYHQQVGWDIHEDGTIQGPEHLTCNILQDSTKFIVNTYKKMWEVHLRDTMDRKGTGDFVINTSLGRKVFTKMSEEEQQLLSLNVVGGFQTEKKKAS